MFIQPFIAGALFLSVLAGACAQTDRSPGDRPPADGLSGDRPPPDGSPAEGPPAARGQFSTDFSTTVVDFSEVISGGPGKDGIPSIDDPMFVPVRSADEWLEDEEAVLVLSSFDTVRVYPLQILMWHEIVNDTLDGEPVAVTFCPLCNTGIAFSRKVGDQVLTFGTTGLLRFSNLIMYDRSTESWWQQATGRSIVGHYAGIRLNIVPIQLMRWDLVSGQWPGAEVLSRDTGHSRPYGRNPYTNYDSSSQPFLFRGALNGDRPPMDRVVVVDAEDQHVAVTYEEAREAVVVQRSAGGEDYVFLWDEETASALDDGRVGGGRTVGSVNVFFPRLMGSGGTVPGGTHRRSGSTGSGAPAAGPQGERGPQGDPGPQGERGPQGDPGPLTFRYRFGRIRDHETGSTWNALGYAISGPLKGQRLEPAPSIQHFWFSYAAFAGEYRAPRPER